MGLERFLWRKSQPAGREVLLKTRTASGAKREIEAVFRRFWSFFAVFLQQIGAVWRALGLGLVSGDL
jgi:hypothetical protein